jgi:site-specific DNA recombinase
MNVAGYIRVSTEQQKAEGSHENQRERLESWADRNDHHITIFSDIAISGQADDRPAYDELMDDATSGEFDAVAVRELSRFGRSLQQVLNDIERLNDAGVDFISVTESFDTSSAMGKAMMQMIGVFNEFWANLARERAQEMVERRREEGKPLGRPTKLTEEEIEEVVEWREKGLSYSAIGTLVEDAFGVDVSRQTIYRYCRERTD